MGLLKSLRSSLHKKRTLKLRMKGGSGCGGHTGGSTISESFGGSAATVGGGRRRRRTGRRRRRTGSRRRR
jgi:hypothetical protein